MHNVTSWLHKVECSIVSNEHLTAMTKVKKVSHHKGYLFYSVNLILVLWLQVPVQEFLDCSISAERKAIAY